MHVRALARLAFASALATSTGLAGDSPSSLPVEGLPVTNGVVTDVELDGDSLFVSGGFTYAGPATGPFLMVDASAEEVLSARSILGEVRAVVEHPGGGWLLGGDFQTFSGLKNLVHLTPGGTLSDLGLPEIAWIKDMVLDGTTLYVAGQCYPSSDDRREAAFAVDLDTQQVLPWHPTPGLQFTESQVPESIVVHGDQVVIAGQFEKPIQGVPRRNLFRVDKVSAALDLTWDPAPDFYVAALKLESDSLYLGGGFTQIFGQPRDAVAEYDLSTDTLTPFSAEIDGNLLALEVVGQRLVLGGRFEGVNGQPRTHLAALDRASAILFPWAPEVRGATGGTLAVHALAAQGDRVVVGGHFSFLAGRRRKNVGDVDVSTGLGSDWAPNVDDAFNANGLVWDLAVSGDDVALAGKFNLGCAQFRTGLLEINLETGRLTDWQPRLFAQFGQPWPGSAGSIELTADAVYFGGTFARVNGVPMRALAAVDRLKGALVEGFSPPMPFSGQPSVGPLEIYGDTLYVSGNFVTTDLGYRDLCALDLATGALRSEFNGAEGFRVWGFAYSPQLDDLYVCGQFTEIGNPWIPAERVARLDPVSGVPTPYLGASNFTPERLQHYRGALFLAGGFTQLNGQQREHLGALDAATGALLPFDAAIDGFGTAGLSALAVADGVVYIGGRIESVGGLYRRGAASVDVVTGAPTAWDPRIKGEPWVIATSRHYVAVGGEFSRSGDVATHNLAVFPMQSAP